MKKRFLACLLALCLLVCGGLPMGASAIEIADSTILAQHFQLDGSGEFTKETFSSTTSHHLTPGSFGDISIEDNSTANLYVESTDMSELEFGVPILTDEIGNTWYLRKINVANYIPDSPGFGEHAVTSPKSIEAIGETQISKATNTEDYTYDFSNIDEINPLLIGGTESYYFVWYGWTTTPPTEWNEEPKSTYTVKYDFNLPVDAPNVYPVLYFERDGYTLISIDDSASPAPIINKISTLSNEVVDGRNFYVAEDFTSGTAGEYVGFMAFNKTKDIKGEESSFYYFDGWSFEADKTNHVFQIRGIAQANGEFADENDIIKLLGHWTQIETPTEEQLAEYEATLPFDIFTRGQNVGQNVLLTQLTDTDENLLYRQKTGNPVTLDEDGTISYLVSTNVNSTLTAVSDSNAMNYSRDFAQYTISLDIDNKLQFKNTNNENVTLTFNSLTFKPINTNFSSVISDADEDDNYTITFNPSNVPLVDGKMHIEIRAQWKEGKYPPIYSRNITVTGLDFKLKEKVSDQKSFQIETTANITGTMNERKKVPFNNRTYYDTAYNLLMGSSAWQNEFGGSIESPTAFVHALKFMNYKLADYDLSTDPNATLKANTVIATYPTYTITVNQGENGTIDPSTISVYPGENKTFTITPDEGFEIADVKVDGESVGAVNTYTFTNVTANHIIEATFEKKPTKPTDPPYIPPVDPDEPADPDDTGVSDLLNTEDHIQYLFGYPDGTFGPENNMTRAEVAQMFYNLLLDQDVEITKTFDDVPANAWYTKAVNTLASLDIISGVGDNKFEPERSITRAEFTAMAMKFAVGGEEGENIFSDVDEDDWFYEAVVNSIQYGWIHGYGDGTFRPNNPITRAEVTAIVNNMLGRAADEDFVDEHAEELTQFSDIEKHWAYYHIVEATNDHDYTKPSSGENWTKLN